MQFNDMLKLKRIEPSDVLVLRHAPQEPELKRVLPWLAAEHPHIFNAYQQTQTRRTENALFLRKYLASFIGLQTGKALFIGLYRIGENRPLTEEEYWQIPAYQKLKEYGLSWSSGNNTRERIYWFDLRICEDFYTEWKGKLVVNWLPPDRGYRNAENNVFRIHAIFEESVLDQAMPPWEKLDLTWKQLKVAPAKWRSELERWRGVYFIFDESDGKGYVGAAYGRQNILGRWQNYADTGHGDNVQLRKRDPNNFRFSILQRVSPDLEKEDVERLESAWKDRLHTRTHGLNGN